MNMTTGRCVALAPALRAAAGTAGALTRTELASRGGTAWSVPSTTTTVSDPGTLCRDRLERVRPRMSHRCRVGMITARSAAVSSVMWPARIVHPRTRLLSPRSAHPRPHQPVPPAQPRRLRPVVPVHRRALPASRPRRVRAHLRRPAPGRGGRSGGGGIRGAPRPLFLVSRARTGTEDAAIPAPRTMEARALEPTDAMECIDSMASRRRLGVGNGSHVVDDAHPSRAGRYTDCAQPARLLAALRAQLGPVAPCLRPAALDQAPGRAPPNGDGRARPDDRHCERDKPQPPRQAGF